MAKSGVDNMFMGEFYGRLDEKGRITLPSKLREDLGSKFIITRGLDGCIFVYPKDEWKNVIEKYKELPNTKETRTFMRAFLSCAIETDFDKQGRINIALPLINWANIKKDAVIIGVNERLEIWSKEVWEEYLNCNKENFSDIADKLFGTNMV